MTLNLSLHEKLLIIGCGDIGRRLATQLDPLHYQITGLKRSATANLANLQYRQCDVTHPQALEYVIREGFDVIVISMTPSERSDAGYKSAYVDTCHHLIDALKMQTFRPRLLVFVSSTGVYAQDDGSWVDETSPTAPETFSGKRLVEAEQIIQQSGYAHLIVRFSGIYGPGRYRLIEQVKQARASNSPHYTNRIHADDCAGVLAHLINLRKNQALPSIILATDSSPTPMVDVVSWIAERLQITDFLATDSVNERGNKRISNRRLLDSGYTFKYPDFKQGYQKLLDEENR